MTAIQRTDAREVVTADDVLGYAKNARSSATWRAYGSDWADFQGFAGESALPATPQMVAAYLVHLHKRGLKPSTISRRLAAISVRHKGAGRDTPTQNELVLSTLAGIRREAGVRPNRKEPLRVRHLKVMMDAGDGGYTAVRARAILLLGYAGGFRRSELSALNVEDVRPCREGLTVLVRRSKTDQAGEGMVKAIPYGSNPATCPVRAVSAWLECAGGSGPLFRRIRKGGKVTGERLSGQAICEIVKLAAESAGLDPAIVGAHSLRAGLVTDAYAAGVPEAVVMDQTGHRSTEVLRIYRREADMFKHNAAGAVGL